MPTTIAALLLAVAVVAAPRPPARGEVAPSGPGLGACHASPGRAAARLQPAHTPASR